MTAQVQLESINVYGGKSWFITVRGWYPARLSRQIDQYTMNGRYVRLYDRYEEAEEALLQVQHVLGE